MQRIVISASRRTDIPAFYMPWFMTQIEQGYFEVINPYNRRPYHVPAHVDQIHSLVFWSKNFGPFIEGHYDQHLTRKGYRFFFNFTINSPHEILEPCVPTLAARLEQLARLADSYGPQTIQWRFDPICYFTLAQGKMGNNLDQFENIAQHAARCGISVCITSFVDLYQKVQRRQVGMPLKMYDPPMHQKVAQIVAMNNVLDELDIRLELCCEKELLAALPAHSTVNSAACIPNGHLAKLYGADISLKRDSGQRRAKGCGCGISKDIGSYALHPCKHNCLFCYANPIAPQAVKD